MPVVFISYRREDSAAFASRLNGAIVNKLGRKGVVFDNVSIPAGIDYRDFLSQAIRQCDVFVAVIGKKWAGGAIDGDQRLSREDDPVRVEIEVALQTNKLVIPVLIEGACMPTEQNLPASLKTLAYKNAIPFSDLDEFAVFVRKVLNAIDDFRKPQRLIRRLTLFLILFAASTIALAITSVVLRNQLDYAKSDIGLKEHLRHRDTNVFSPRNPEDTVGVARAFPNRNTLDKSGSLIEQVQHARQSFDLFALSGKAVADAEATIVESVERGVHIRIVLVDHSEANATNVANYISFSLT